MGQYIEVADLVDEVEVDGSVPVVFPLLVADQRIALQIDNLQISDIAQGHDIFFLPDEIVSEIDDFKVLASSLNSARADILNAVITCMDLPDIGKFVDEGGDIFKVVVVDVEQFELEMACAELAADILYGIYVVFGDVEHFDVAVDHRFNTSVQKRAVLYFYSFD